MKAHSSLSLPAISGTVIALVGLALGAAGAWLVLLGGSWYYLIAALGLIAAGALLKQHSVIALSVFAALLLGSLGWAVWEVGLDWWPLAARLGVLFLVGAFISGPWIVWALGPRQPEGAYGHGRTEHASWRRGGGLALTVTLGACALVMLASWTRDLHKVTGTLQTVRTQAAVGESGPDSLPDGEWTAYGRTGFGQRYSPLAQITPANVSRLAVAWQFRTGDLRGQPGDPEETTYEVTPLKVGERLYLCNPHQSVIALDATTGAEV